MGLKGMVRTLAVGAAAGAAAVWFSDPDRGPERRQQFKAKADETAGQLGIDLDQTTQDLRTKAQEVAAEARDKAQDKVQAVTGQDRSGGGDDGGDPAGSTTPTGSGGLTTPGAPAPSGADGLITPSGAGMGPGMADKLAPPPSVDLTEPTAPSWAR